MLSVLFFSMSSEVLLRAIQSEENVRHKNYEAKSKVAIIHITYYILRKTENNITSYKNLSVYLAKYMDPKKAEKKKTQ